MSLIDFINELFANNFFCSIVNFLEGGLTYIKKANKLLKTAAESEHECKYMKDVFTFHCSLNK